MPHAHNTLFLSSSVDSTCKPRAQLEHFHHVQEFIRYVIDLKCVRQSADDKRAPRILVAVFICKSGSTTASVLKKITQWRMYYMRNSRRSPLLNKLSKIFFMLLISDLSDISRGVVLNFFCKKIIILLGSLNLVCMCGFNFLFSTFLLIFYSKWWKKNH